MKLLFHRNRYSLIANRNYFLTFTACGLVCLQSLSGCDRATKPPAADDSVSSQVQDIVESYSVHNETRDKARRLGVKMIPVLRKMLDDPEADHHAVAGVLIDFGFEESLQVLVEALAGKTHIRDYQAAMYIRAFATKHRWPPEKYRAIRGLVPAVMSFLKKNPDRIALGLAEKLKLKEALPFIRELKSKSEGKVLEACNQAILAIQSGE